MEERNADVLADVLAGLARTLLGDNQVTEILEWVTHHVSEVLPVTGAGVLLQDDDQETLRADVASDETVLLLESLQVDLGQGPGVAAHESGGHVLVPDLATWVAVPAFVERALASGLRAVFSFPMRHEKQRLGAIDLYSETARALSSADVAAGQTLADITAVYLLHARDLERARLAEEELVQRAFTDPLTGLPNRRLFVDHLDLALSRSPRTGRAVTVLFLDLDRFKQVNDRYGHVVGDRLLIEVGERLRSVVRPNDTAARLGGDEFAVVCDELDGPGEACSVGMRILNAIQAPIRSGGQLITVSTSIGVATSTALETDAEALLAAADAAMYRAKSQGGGRFELRD